MILGTEDAQMQDSLQRRWVNARRNDSAGWKIEGSQDRLVGPCRNCWGLKKKKWRLPLAGSASVNSSGYSQKVLRELKKPYHPRRKKSNHSPKKRRKYLLRKTKLLNHQGNGQKLQAFLISVITHQSWRQTTRQRQKGLSGKRDGIQCWAQSCENWKAHTHT